MVQSKQPRASAYAPKYTYKRTQNPATAACGVIDVQQAAAGEEVEIRGCAPLTLLPTRITPPPRLYLNQHMLCSDCQRVDSPSVTRHVISPTHLVVEPARLRHWTPLLARLSRQMRRVSNGTCALGCVTSLLPDYDLSVC